MKYSNSAKHKQLKMYKITYMTLAGPKHGYVKCKLKSEAEKYANDKAAEKDMVVASVVKAQLTEF